MPGGADDAKLGLAWEGGDQPVDSLVRRDAADEEDAASDELFVREVPVRVGAAVDDACSGGRRPELARRIDGHREEAVEEPREEASPRSAAKAVVRDGRPGAPSARKERGRAARRASHVMGVDDVGRGERACEPEPGGMRRMPGEMDERAEDADAKAARVAAEARRAAEDDELAVDVPGEGSRELERIPLAAAEDAGRPEERGSDVDDAHLVLPLLTLGDPRRLSGGYLYHLRMAEAAPSHRAKIVFLSFPERPFPLAAASAPRLVGRVRELGGAALLLDSIAAAFAAPALAARRLGVPVIGVLHQPPGGIDHGALRARAQAPLDRLAWASADLLIVASAHLAEQLAAVGVPPARIRVVPPGRDVAATPNENPRDLRSGRRTAVLCVANWLERKGVLELLEAFSRLPAEAATLHLAGDPDADRRYAGRVRRRLAAGDLAGRVVLHGRLTTDQVATLYAGADVFALPAFREPYGTVWGEAMAFGLPVVGWRAGNLPYLADDEREALLVEPGDREGLARALARLVADEELRARLGEAARRRASTRPTWVEAARLFFDVIRSVVDGASAGGGRAT